MKITVYLGTGGVGKTSVAAATALASARAGTKCLVLAADPSRCLRTTLGLKDGLHEHRVALHPPGPGELWAALMDVRATLDAAVRHSAPPRDRDTILRHPIYRTLADSLSGMPELMLLERIDQLHRRGFDHIVVDTAPSHHALEMLDHPALFAEFTGSNWLKLLGRTYKFTEGLGMMALGRKAVDTYGRVESMLGSRLVREVLDFYAQFAPVAEAYALRAPKTVALLKDASVTGYRIVSSPQKARRDTRYFSEALQKRGLLLSRIYVNRVWEREPVEGAAGEAAEWYRCMQAAQSREIAMLREEFGNADVRIVGEVDEVDGLEGLDALAEVVG